MPNLSLHPVVVQSAYSKAFLLKLSDKVHVNHQYQCLPPLACQNIQQLGLCRRGKRGGKRRNRHLDIIRPCRTNPKNLVRVTIKVDISKYQQDQSLTFLLLSVQSVKNKDLIIHHEMVQNKIDILLLTETWLTSKETDKIWIDCCNLNKDRYNLTSAIRENRRGGLALITKNDFTVKLVSNAELRTFQFAKWNVQLMHTNITVLGIYRPPAGSPVEFLTEFTNWIIDVMAHETNLLVAGDFNLHINNKNYENAANFMESMVALGLVQHVTEPTHKCGNILDLIFMENFSKIDIHSCTVGNLLLDHHIINCKTSFKSQEKSHKHINYHDLASIELELMAKDIKPDILNGDTLDTQVEKLENTLRGALDKHAPLQTKLVMNRQKVAWFTEEVREMKKRMRHREKLWRKYSRDELWMAFKVVRWQYETAIRKAKNTIISDKIQDCKKDTKKLYALVSSLTGKNTENPLPEHEDKGRLSNEFADYFLEKIQMIRTELDQHPKY